MTGGRGIGRLPLSDASQDASENTWQGWAPVEGVWRVTRHGFNCVTGGEVSTFPALMTFHADGTGERAAQRIQVR